MKIFNVNGYVSDNTTAFKGYKRYLDRNYAGDIVLQDHKPSQLDITQDQSEMLLKKAYPNSTVERTLDSFHSKPTGVVYYADPLEGISDKLREQVDYVVYDNEPKYPKVNGEVSENYFGKQRVDYGEKFADIRDYYYRLEMVDTKEAEKYKRNILAGIDTENSKEKLDYYNDRIAKSKYQQWQAAECINLYKKGNGLRSQKEGLEDSIQYIQNEIKMNEEELPKRKAMLKETSEKITKEQAIYDLLEAKDKFYRKSITANKKLIEQNSAQANNYWSEISAIESILVNLSREGVSKNTLIWSLKAKAQECKEFIATFPRRIANMKKQIKANEVQIEQVKANLIPVFDELKNFYAKQKILH